MTLPTPPAERCERCGHELGLVRHPIRQLRWTRYWWRGVESLFTGALKMCGRCGAVYASDGKLMAAGAIQTDVERRLDGYRRDMAYLRDAFGGVVVAGEIAALWLALGPSGSGAAEVLVAASVGVGAVVPFSYFWRKALSAKRDLKRLREARRQGLILEAGKRTGNGLA
jgi:hypothetical protein